MKKKGSILVVDDTPETLALLNKLLTKNGYTVFSAESGELALISIEKFVPDLILLDIRMQGIDGFEVCRNIRSKTEFVDVPIIFLAAATEKKECINGLKLGAVDYILKPFEKEELLARVNIHFDLFTYHKLFNEITAEQLIEKEKLLSTQNTEYFILNEELKESNLNIKNANEEYEAINEKLRQANLLLNSARSKAEENEFKFKSLIENAPDGVVIINAEGNMVYASINAYQHFGYNEDDLLGHSGAEFTHPEDMSTVVKVFDDIVANPGNKYTIEYRFKSKTGDYRWIRTTFSNLLSNKAINGFILNFTDITELKQMLEDIFKAKEKAEESDRLKSAFLANMSHEIRTPMNGILGFADLLKTPDLSGEKQQEYIQIIEKSGIRMLNIIKDIIDISKIESGQIDVHISPTNINENYSFLLNLFKPETEKKGLKLRLKSVLPENEAIIKTDKEKVFAVLSNLIKNAIKFSFKGSIEFGLKKKDNYLEFYVKDMGVGIPQEQLKIIFERFRQGSESLSRNYEGAGLGLAISKAYVEILGGNIRAESEVGKGSTFYFTIPYESESIESKVITDQISESKEVNQINNLKVLIAEDDDTIEKLIAFKIKRYCKEIHIARNGLEAIQICRSHPDIDLVLMDIKMPVLNGYKATEQIRQFNKDVIIIAQTAYALSGDKDKAIKAGCNDYISKPYDYSKLNLLIEKYFV